MKIRCSECAKKIAIDDAFAGGVCRCPYCTALVFVADEAAAREAAPGERPSARPQSPDEMEAVAKARGQQEIPTASPVKVQGIVTLVLIGILVLMMGVGGVLVWKATHKSTGPGNDTGTVSGEAVNPFVMEKGKGPLVAGNIPMTSPILYVIDGGDSMKEMFNNAVAMVRLSVRTLGSDDKFTILVCREEKDELMPGGYLGGNAAGTAEAKTFLESVLVCTGATDIPRALKLALDQKPKTIVLFVRKPVDDAMVMAAKAKEMDVHIMVIGLDCGKDVGDSLRNLGAATDGTSRAYDFSTLRTHQATMPPLDD